MDTVIHGLPNEDSNIDHNHETNNLGVVLRRWRSQEVPLRFSIIDLFITRLCEKSLKTFRNDWKMAEAILSKDPVQRQMFFRWINQDAAKEIRLLFAEATLQMFRGHTFTHSARKGHEWCVMMLAPSLRDLYDKPWILQWKKQLANSMHYISCLLGIIYAFGVDIAPLIKMRFFEHSLVFPDSKALFKFLRQDERWSYDPCRDRCTNSGSDRSRLIKNFTIGQIKQCFQNQIYGLPFCGLAAVLGQVRRGGVREPTFILKAYTITGKVFLGVCRFEKHDMLHFWFDAEEFDERYPRPVENHDLECYSTDHDRMISNLYRVYDQRDHENDFERISLESAAPIVAMTWREEWTRDKVLQSEARRMRETGSQRVRLASRDCSIASLHLWDERYIYTMGGCPSGTQERFLLGYWALYEHYRYSIQTNTKVNVQLPDTPDQRPSINTSTFPVLPHSFHHFPKPPVASLGLIMSFPSADTDRLKKLCTSIELWSLNGCFTDHGPRNYFEDLVSLEDKWEDMLSTLYHGSFLPLDTELFRQFSLLFRQMLDCYCNILLRKEDAFTNTIDRRNLAGYPSRLWTNVIARCFRVLGRFGPNAIEHLMMASRDAYRTLCLLYERVPEFKTDWTFYLGFLALRTSELDPEGSSRDEWKRIWMHWLSNISENHPDVGGLFAFRASLEPFSMYQLYLYAASLTSSLRCRTAAIGMKEELNRFLSGVSPPTYPAEKEVLTFFATDVLNWPDSVKRGLDAADSLATKDRRFWQQTGATLAVVSVTSLMGFGDPENKLWNALANPYRLERSLTALESYDKTAANFCFFEKCVKTVARCCDDPSTMEGVLPYLYVILTWLHICASRAASERHLKSSRVIDQTLGVMPWGDIVRSLNKIVDYYQPINNTLFNTTDKYMRDYCGQIECDLPEDALMKSLTWTAPKLPQTKYSEHMNSFELLVTFARAKRVMQMAMDISKCSDYIRYDGERGRFLIFEDGRT